jgi:hypothetical protein
MDGQRTVAEISSQIEASGEGGDIREAIRQLAQRGIVDLLTEPISMGKIPGKVVAVAM